MKFETLDDYYVWTCEWCDSVNRTLWVKVAHGEMACGACHLATSLPTASHGINRQMSSGIMSGLC